MSNKQANPKNACNVKNAIPLHNKISHVISTHSKYSAKSGDTEIDSEAMQVKWT